MKLYCRNTLMECLKFTILNSNCQPMMSSQLLQQRPISSLDSAHTLILVVITHTHTHSLSISSMLYSWYKPWPQISSMLRFCWFTGTGIVLAEADLMDHTSYLIHPAAINTTTQFHHFLLKSISQQENTPTAQQQISVTAVYSYSES